MVSMGSCSCRFLHHFVYVMLSSIFLHNFHYKCPTNRPVSSVAKRTLSVREVWGSIPRPVKLAQCRLATVVTFVRSCVAQALSRGDSLHASA